MPYLKGVISGHDPESPGCGSWNVDLAKEWHKRKNFLSEASFKA